MICCIAEIARLIELIVDDNDDHVLDVFPGQVLAPVFRFTSLVSQCRIVTVQSENVGIMSQVMNLLKLLC